MDFSYLASLTLPLPLLIALACLCSIALSLLLKRFILARIQRWVSRTPFTLDSLLLQSLNVPFTLFVLIANALLLKNILLYFEYPIDSFAVLHK